MKNTLDVVCLSGTPLAAPPVLLNALHVSKISVKRSRLLGTYARLKGIGRKQWPAVSR